ncbi:MAG TPA: recombination mediator RecR [Verrucomicrobiae bacterium]|nr:recombination mediator RecR [Verrucomicrobiae bacterium]
MPLPEPITVLTEALCRLPGIGPRSAERLALHLVQSEPDVSQRLANAILSARAKIRLCSVCGALTEADPCSICQDSRRDSALLCVVERPLDIFALEKSGGFRGKYHVLGGRISPMNGVEPEDLRIAELESRLGGVTEIIVALSTDVEGDATSFYLGKRLAGKGVKVSRIAHGLPAGTGLEFADEVTLSRALEGRRELLP